ncbi:30S ribosomal protein S13 [Flavobacteriaceae bacterium]|nr:30S ribosomal protein S13 [Flavobacteriaceae bacterium]
MLYRIFSVTLPDNKAIAVSLTSIYGIGYKTALAICKTIKVKHSIRTKDLKESDIDKIRAYIKEQGFILEGDLRRKVSADIKRLVDIGCYRGIRHVRKLPVRGQRTSTNARTRKGKSVAIAGKKK